jgi:hypothetical protein
MLHKDAQQSDCCSQLRIRISYGQSGLTPHQAPAFFKAAAIRCAAFAVWNEHFLGHGSFPLLGLGGQQLDQLRLAVTFGLAHDAKSGWLVRWCRPWVERAHAAFLQYPPHW